MPRASRRRPAGADRARCCRRGADGVDAAPPPAPASLPELKSFVTHLAAGLLGGLVGVVGLALRLGGLDFGEDRAGRSRTSPRWKQRIAKLETAPPASGDAEALAQAQGAGRSLGDGRQGNLAQACRACRPRRPTRNLAQGHLAESAERRRLGRLRPPPSPSRSPRPSSGSTPRSPTRLPKRDAANASTLAADAERDRRAQGQDRRLAEPGTGDRRHRPELAALTERLAKLEAALPELAAAIGKENNRSQVGGGGHRLRQSSRRGQRWPALRRRARHDQRARALRRRSRRSAGLCRKGHPDRARACALLRRRQGGRAGGDGAGLQRFAGRHADGERAVAGEDQTHR